MSRIKGRNIEMKEHRISDRKGRIIVSIIGCGLLCVLFCMFGGSLNNEEGLHYDENAQYGTIDGLSAQEIEALMKEKMEEGKFQISINSNVIFETGEASGNVEIENHPQNRYDMQVTIVEEHTREVLYRTQLIRPGYYIAKDYLEQDLEAGTYDAVAIFVTYQGEEFEEVGTTEASLKITVLE